MGITIQTLSQRQDKPSISLLESKIIMSAAKGYRTPAGFLDLSPEDRIRMTLTNGGDSHFYSRFLKQCTLESVKSLGPKSTIVTFRCKADPYYSNFSGNLHVSHLRYVNKHCNAG